MRKKSLSPKLIFCKHDWSERLQWEFNDNKLTVTYYKVCSKCGKKKSVFTMPLIYSTPPYEHYQKLKKEFRV